jgi:hypothetical protein
LKSLPIDASLIARSLYLWNLIAARNCAELKIMRSTELDWRRFEFLHLLSTSLPRVSPHAREFQKLKTFGKFIERLQLLDLHNHVILPKKLGFAIPLLPIIA